MVVVTTFLVLIIHLWKKDRVIAGLLLTIPLSILPSYSPIIIAWTAADRYLHIGSAFFSIILAILFLRIEEKKSWKKFALYATLTLCLLYSVRTFFEVLTLKTAKTYGLQQKRSHPTVTEFITTLGTFMLGKEITI